MLRDRSFVLLFIALLFLPACTLARVSEQPPEIACPTPPPVEILTDGWQFVTDPDDAGLAARWFAPDSDRTNWTSRAIGRAWEQDGLDYDGISWYGREVVWEGADSSLFLADADDSATVWVDGIERARLGPDNSSVVLTLDNTDGHSFVALRVVDEGGFGGIKSPPRLSQSELGALDEARLIDFYEQQFLQLPRAPSGRAWTMIGGVDQANEALIGIEGGLSPWADAASTQIWLRNSTTGKTVNPFASGQFSLVDNSPIVRIQNETFDGVTMISESFYDETDDAVRTQVTVNSLPDAGFDELVVAVRPFRVNRTLTDFCNPALTNGGRLWLNNVPYLMARTEPDSFSTTETLAELVYPINDQTVAFDFAFPSAPGDEFPSTNIDFASRLEEAQTQWAERREQAAISIPDQALQSALDASLGYLLLASDPNGPHPGPLAHNAIWTRDAAYMGLALLMHGYDDVARDYVRSVFAGQDADGRVPPIQGEAIPWTNDEWDAQGQAIYLAMQVFRYTEDVAFLRDVYPQMALAADYLIELRQQTANDPPATRGLLPISLSAEDLADGEQHYYWDDFWAVVGLTQAADAADILNEGDGERWRAEAAALRLAIDNSLEQVMGNPVPYIPASVETIDNSGMARGTTPALHPFPIMAPDDPLLIRAFDEYAKRWITPTNGGYLHREGQFWTYGGIELANAYLRLDRGDLVHQILGWTMNHQTLPGTYAWAEQVDPNTYTFTGGDMPHAWMASSLTILIRNMLVLEYATGMEDDALTLFQTAPTWWFEGDRQIVTQGLPTIYGALDLSTRGNLQSVDGRWVGELSLALDGASPPGGFRWKLPFVPTAVEGSSAQFDGIYLTLTEPGEITLTFE